MTDSGPDSRENFSQTKKVVKSLDLRTYEHGEILTIRRESERSFRNLSQKNKITEKPDLERLKQLIEQGDSEIAKRLLLDYIYDNPEDYEILEILLQFHQVIGIGNIHYWSKRLIELRPDSIAGLEIMLDYFRGGGEYEEGMGVSERILNLEKNNISALSFRIANFRNFKDWGALIKECEKLLTFEPDNVFALKEISSALTLQNNKDAEKYWKIYLRMPGILEGEGYRIARIFYNSGNYNDCAQILTGRLEVRQSEEDLELLSRSYYSMGDWSACYECCNNLTHLSPDNLTGLRLRMRSLRKLEDRGEASISAERILENKSDDSEALSTLIRHSASIEDWRAVEDFTLIAMENEDLRLESIRWHARALTRQGRDNALDYWKKLLDEGGDDLETLIEMGKIYFRNYDNDNACKMFDSALELSPEDSRAVRYLASSKLRKGLLEEAVPLLERDCQSNPLRVGSWEKLIETRLRLDDEGAVRSIWKGLLISSWESLDSLIVSLEICLRFHWTERYDWLIETRGRMRKDDPNFLSEVVRIHLKNGNIGASWKTLQLLSPGDTKEKMENEIKKILEILGFEISDLEEYCRESERVWIAALVLKSIIRDRAKLNPIKEDKSVSLISSSLNRGGAERQISNTFCGINRRDFDCELLVRRLDNRGNGETYENQIVEFKDRVVEIAMASSPSVKRDSFSDRIDLLPGSTKEMVQGLIVRFSSRCPTIVHAWQDETILSASIASLICGVPRIIGSARSMRPDEKSDLHIRKRPYIRQCMKELMSLNEFHLSTNSYAGRKSYAQWLGIEESVISVIHNGVDFADLERSTKEKPPEAIQSFGLSDSHIIVGGVFRLEPGKRVDLWIDSFELALQKNSKLKGLLVGGGRLEETVKSWLEERGLTRRILLAGSVEDVGTWLKMMDVFLFTSSSEGLPNVLIEAQGFGVPVISTDVGGVAEIIDSGETGIVVKRDTRESISEALLQVIEHKEHEWSEKAQLRSRREFSIESMIKRTEEVYNQVLST